MIRQELKAYLPLRFWLLVALLGIGMAGLIWRMLDLTVVDRVFLQSQGDARVLRTVTVPAYRGMITDRNGEPLAVSTPVDSIWVYPKEFKPTAEQLDQLAKVLGLDIAVLKKYAGADSGREFVYLKRQVDPAISKQVKGLAIAGVYSQREYKRYYPEGEVAAQVVGFTNIDDQGQEGMELAFNDWLQGVPGTKRVIKDRLGHIVANVEDLREPRPGHNLALSIDRRIQYSAYRELKEMVSRTKATSATAVVLDVETGEVLAMVNQPSFNPNQRSSVHDGRFRNRTVTDVFEPGSTLKAFSMTAALLDGDFSADSVVNTSPGWMVIGRGKTVRDMHDNGQLSLTQILQKSSNVGMTKVILSLPADSLWGLLEKMGFGQSTASGFPGEREGELVYHRRWTPFTLATLSFGYGISVTTLQLASAYTTLAANGIKKPVSLLRVDGAVKGQRVLPERVASEIVTMLEAVVGKGGTALRARIPGYSVAGKTGTVRMVGPNGYEKDHHIAIFVGTAPATRPKLVMAVVIRDPQGSEFYGGQIAAPVFSRVMASALRTLDIAPDKVGENYAAK